jgi:transglutaminase-like putative cysteine protease
MTVPDGAPGTRAVLREMARVVRWAKAQPTFRILTQRLLADLPSKAWMSEIRTIFNYVRENMRYMMDTNEIEILQSPEVSLTEGSGDCDDFCMVLATLLECAGHPCRFVALAFQEPGQFEHVLLQTRLPDLNRWVSLDATEDFPLGWFPPDSVDRMVQDV